MTGIDNGGGELILILLVWVMLVVARLRDRHARRVAYLRRHMARPR